MPPASPFIAGNILEVSAIFDGIFSNNVIEHLRDPLVEFAAMASRLKPDGTIVHATPCFDLLHEDTRFHTSFYLGRSIDVLGAAVGLEVVDRDRDGEYISVTMKHRR